MDNKTSNDGDNLFVMAQRCLCEPIPLKKLELTKQAYQLWQRDELSLQAVDLGTLMTEPGRPARPRLVEPKHLARRNPGTLLGHAALMHAIAHIEFNAINLAWDAVYRFRDLPVAFYHDWILVASEEASHFQWVVTYLNRLGYDYGDFDAHHGLWQVAMQTAHDPLLRIYYKLFIMKRLAMWKLAVAGFVIYVSIDR